MKSRELRISLSNGEAVGALLLKPKNAKALFVFAHGAGAGMRHPFMQRMAELLAEEFVATLRYNFLYMEKGMKRPDPKPLLHEVVRNAIGLATREARELPIFIGGKSMGGRMSSELLAGERMDEIKGIIFFGFPLHPAGSPSITRAAHLEEAAYPMLFLQGEKDKLAELKLLRPVIRSLGTRATLHVIPNGDHSFHIPKSSGRTDEDVLKELAYRTNEWIMKQA